jgi:thiol-disulfide isomerase/thioredoxin
VAGGTLALGALAFAGASPGPARAEPEAPAIRELQAIPPTPRPGFTLPETAGGSLTLADWRGRIVLVHFFATWCEPCRAELASLSWLVQGGAHGKQIAVVAVNVAEVPVRVRRFLEAAPVSFPVVLDVGRAVTRAWGVSILPTTFVLDPALQPRLLVEGDLEWSRPDVLAALAAIEAAPSEAAGAASQGEIAPGEKAIQDRPIGRSE